MKLILQKLIFNKWLLAFVCSLSLIGASTVTLAHGGGGGGGKRHVYCFWVKGHKNHGKWIPGHKVCCKWVKGHWHHGKWIHGHKECWWVK